MRPTGRTLLLATAALVLLPSGAAEAKKHKPKMTQCGAYSAADGSLAAQVVQSIAASKGTSCSKGQSIAGGYAGQVGTFKVSGWRCSLDWQTPNAGNTVRCTRGSGVISYALAASTNCSSTPGADEQHGGGPYVFNIDCASAVPVYNSVVSQGWPPKAPPGWTCTTDSDAEGDGWWSCVMKTGSSTQVVQGGPSLQ